MTPTQQLALEALARRSLTGEEIALAESRVDDGALAAALSGGRTRIAQHWLTDRGLVAEIAPAYGVPMTDSILSKLDAAALTSRSIRALVGRLGADGHGLDFGDPALRAWIAESGGFSADEVSALLSLAVVSDPIAADVVSDALNRD